MKLARPDTFHPRIVLAGGAQHAAGDDAGLVAALRTRGLHARWLPWDDPGTSDAHLVILRDAGDYAGRLDEFLTWTGRVQNLLNPAPVIAWNAERGYLDELARQGIPTVPGQVCEPGESVRLPSDGPVYVGAIRGAGLRRFTDRLDAQAYIKERRESVFIQSDSAPETVLIFIGGKPSHAFTVQDGGLHQGEADFELWDVGAAALHVVPGESLYARAHLAGARLLELQLVDPSLGWLRLDAETRGSAQREFALAVESALERLGLGPFSHRRP
ncbi:hypothetical protein A9W97_30800 [Mycobacterium gordonae]|nr:hypothetical protein [Mycobacterium gordonae]OBJ79433.1 hypothetical protein A9W97_30800 [Mycobacterium gordonae]